MPWKTEGFQNSEGVQALLYVVGFMHEEHEVYYLTTIPFQRGRE